MLRRVRLRIGVRVPAVSRSSRLTGGARPKRRGLGPGRGLGISGAGWRRSVDIACEWSLQRRALGFRRLGPACESPRRGSSPCCAQVSELSRILPSKENCARSLNGCHRWLASLQNEAAVADFVRETSLAGKPEGANYESLLPRKPQISLAFDPQESNGRDVLRIDPPIG